MRVVPSDELSSLVRPRQEQLELMQEYQNQIMRAMVDNAALQANPQMMIGKSPPPMNLRPGQVTHVTPPRDTRTMKALLTKGLRSMIPEVVWENVYRTDEAHVIAGDCELIKLTFYNDQMITLKVRFEEETSMIGGINVVTPLCDDFEEWCATAIMKCDAGEDVWERPKSGAVGGSPNLTATAARAQQLQAMQQMQQLAGNPYSGSAEAGAGLAGAFGQGYANGLLGAASNQSGRMK